MRNSGARAGHNPAALGLAVLLLDRSGCVSISKILVNYLYSFIFSFKMRDPNTKWEGHQFPSPVYACQGKHCRQNTFPATSLYFWNGNETHDAGWYCSACLSWTNVGTVELVTLAEAFIETLPDKAESSKANE